MKLFKIVFKKKRLEECLVLAETVESATKEFISEASAEYSVQVGNDKLVIQSVEEVCVMNGKWYGFIQVLPKITRPNKNF